MRKLIGFIGGLAMVCGSASMAWGESPVGSKVSISSVTTTEGNVGKIPFSAQVNFYSVAYYPVTITIRAVPGTADEKDYEFAPINLKFSSGDAQTVTGYILGDLEPEGNETFTLVATAAPDSGVYGYFYSTGGQVTITDDDMERASRLYVDDTTVMEGDVGTHTVDVRVRLEPAATNTVTVGYTAAPPDGIFVGNGSQAHFGTLTFIPGEVLKIIPLTIQGNTTWQGDRSFRVNLSAPTVALLGIPYGTVTIKEDDAPVHVFLADQEIVEGNDGVQIHTLTVQLDHPVMNQPKVWIKYEARGATLGEDFQGAAETLYPAQGSTSVTFKLSVQGDSDAECDEGLLIYYQGVYMGDDIQKVARVLIRDDDGGRTECPDPFAIMPQWLDGGATTDPNTDPKVTNPPQNPDAGVPDSVTLTDHDGGIVLMTAAPNTHKANDERSSVGCTIADGAGASGFVLLVVGLGLGLFFRRLVSFH